MDNAEVFLTCFNGLEDWLRKQNRQDKHDSFHDLVNNIGEKNKVVRNHAHFLRRMGNLRNAILHDTEYPVSIIAIPKESIVEKFESICRTIYEPKTALQIATKKIATHTVDVGLSEVLILMKNNDFSQIIIRKPDDSYGVLTREGIARWMESNIEEDLISIKEAKIDDILPFESTESWQFIEAKATIYDALSYFSDTARRVQALLVTQNGRVKEKPIGLITFWDISREMIDA